MKFNRLESLADIKFPTELERKYNKIEEEIFSSISSLDKEINISSIKSFFESFGLKIPRLLVLDKHGISSLQEIFDKYGYSVDPKTCLNNIGLFFAEINTVLINYDYVFGEDKSIQDVRGRSLIDGFVVHEFSHGTSSRFDFKPDKDNPYIQRIGFWVKNELGEDEGLFFEEGFAELMRIRFYEDNKPDESDEDIFNSEGISIPKKYLVVDSNKEKRILPSSIAGYALMLLIEDDNILFDKIIKSRNSKKELHECIDFINARWSGLFNKLKDLKITYEDFSKGLQEVQKSVK